MAYREGPAKFDHLEPFLAECRRELGYWKPYGSENWGQVSEMVGHLIRFQQFVVLDEKIHNLKQGMADAGYKADRELERLRKLVDEKQLALETAEYESNAKIVKANDEILRLKAMLEYSQTKEVE